MTHHGQYTDWGLIYTVGRSATNYRLFDADALWCVRMIGQLRDLGLTVAEIRELTSTDAPIGPRLAALLHLSLARLTRRVTELRRTLRRERLTLTPGAGHTVAAEHHTTPSLSEARA